MAKAIIYVFSGTKNTLTTAEMIRNSLSDEDVSTTIQKIKKPFDHIPSPQGYDFVGFGYPVHAFNTPQVFLEYAKLLPAVAHCKAFIFKTSGEPFFLNKASSFKLYQLLQERNFDIILEKHLLMPYNIVFRYDNRLVKQMYMYNLALCKQLTQQLLGDDREVINYHLRHRFISFILRFQWFGAKINGVFYHANRDKCNLCLRCVKSCPLHNISVRNDKLKFGRHCAMCMRCAVFCPKDAINPGLLGLLKVNGAYDFDRIVHNKHISPDFINEKTRGYFGLFKKYYKSARSILSKYHIDIEE